MCWATFWALFSQAHLVTLLGMDIKEVGRPFAEAAQKSAIQS
jgi:hypothetical protein